MSQSYIKTRSEDRILFVTLARPEKRNALTPEMIDDLAAAIRDADRDPALRAVIVSGEGPIFSAGSTFCRWHRPR